MHPPAHQRAQRSLKFSSKGSTSSAFWSVWLTNFKRSWLLDLAKGKRVSLHCLISRQVCDRWRHKLSPAA